MTDPLSLLLPAPKRADKLEPLAYGARSAAWPQHDLAGSPVELALIKGLRSHEVEAGPELELKLEELSAGSAKHEAYELFATGSKVIIRAHDTSGIRHAMQTLTQWLRINKPGQLCPGLEVSDEPDLRERGVMLDISRDRVPTLSTACQLVELLASCKINRLQLYTEHTFAYSGADHICSPASPWSAQEIQALDAHAAHFGIELVPNQQSFGHMHRWLSHDSHRHLAEVPEGVQHPFHPVKQPFSLCPTDPASLTFLESLYDELLPNFQSQTFNVGLDETFDLGLGRSKGPVQERGVAAVYLDFLCAVHELVTSRGHRMQCWADVVLNHPEVVPDLPSDVEPILWGYEANHPLDAEAEILSRSCASFQIAPGTSSWQSLGGRTDNCISNLRSAASAARAHGASGLLITDWGDRGHLQPMPVSYLGFLHGAECAWNGAAAEERSDEALAALLDHHAFRSPDAGLGSTALELGRASDPCDVKTENMSALFYPIGFPERTLPDERIPGLTPEAYDHGQDRVAQLRTSLTELSAAQGEGSLCKDEFAWVLDLMETACELGRARAGAPRGSDLSAVPGPVAERVATQLRALGERHAELWLIRSRPGGLSDSVHRLHGIADLLHPQGQEL